MDRDTIILLLQRLKQPSVLTGIVAQVASLLMLFNLDINASHVTEVITIALYLIVTLILVSNPSSKIKETSENEDGNSSS